ncbi:MAG: carboxypeptidase-like regulatory domain-containing protein [Acidobacteriota bacterium]
METELQALPARSEYARLLNRAAALGVKDLAPLERETRARVAEGAASLPLELELPTGMWDLKLGAQGYRPRCVTAVADRGQLDLGHRELRARSTRSLEVLDPAGEAIAGAFILEVGTPANPLEWHDCQGFARSDGEGWIEIDEAFGGPWILGASGFVPQLVELLPRADRWSLEPLPDAPRTMKIRDQVGPIEGALALFEGQIPIAISDADGRLSIPTSSPGAVTFIAPDGRRFELEGRDAREVVFADAVRAEGRVVTYHSESVYGVADGLVWVPGWPGLWTPVDREGHFAIPHVPLDEREREPSIRLAAAARGYAPEDYGVFAGPAGAPSRDELLALEMALYPRSPGGGFVGRVLDEEQSPLPATSVYLIRSEAVDQRAELLSGSGVPRGARSSRTDDLGYFRIECFDRAPQDLLVVPEEASPVVVTGLLAPPPGGEEPLGDLVAEFPWRFEGRVLDGERALAGVQISIERSLQLGEWTQSFRDQGSGPLSTDSEGRFSIPIRVARSHPEGVDLIFSKAGFRERALRRVVVEPDARVTVEMEKLEPLAGIVTDDRGEPLSEVRLHLVAESGHGAGRQSPVPGGGRGTPVTHSDDEGFFLFPDRPAADSVLEASREGFAPQRVRVTASSPNILDVQLKPGASILGTVTAEGGSPVSEARLRVGDRYLVTDFEGAFEITGLGPGAWRVEATDERLGRASAQVELAPGETRRVQLTLDASSSASGVVVDGDGRPVAGATVVATGATGQKAYATSGPGGGFRLAALQPGTYRLVASARALATRAPLAFALSEQGASNLRLEMASVGAISGYLVGDTPRPGEIQISWSCAGHPPITGTPAADLSFSLEGLRAGTCWLVASSRGEQLAARELSLAPGESRQAVELVHEEAQALSGRLSLDGKDVGGAEVWLADASGAVLAQTLADWAGHFEVSSQLEGDFVLNARLSGETGVFRRPIRLPGRNNDLIWRLAAGRAVMQATPGSGGSEMLAAYASPATSGQAFNAPGVCVGDTCTFDALPAGQYLFTVVGSARRVTVEHAVIVSETTTAAIQF